MAENATVEAPQAAPEAPAAAAASTAADVTSWAKQEATRLETEAATETPATPAPDSSANPAALAENEAGATSPDDQSQEGEAPKLSRKERDEQRRQEIRTEERAKIEAEFKAAQDAQTALQTQQEQEQTLLNLIARVKAGDYQAGVQLAQISEGQFINLPKQTAREAQVWKGARDALLGDMAKDFEPTLRAIEGFTDENFNAAKNAPTAGQYGKTLYDIGRKHAEAASESRIATLQAEITSLKGQLAARGPSPLSANGSNGHGATLAGKDMRSIAQQVWAEAGVPLN